MLEQLQPQKVFYYFEEICKIPHGSRNLQQISDYLLQFGKDRNLYCRQDEALNVVIKKPGSEGYETAPTVIIQGHMDMVAVQDKDCKKNMETQGLDLAIDGDMIYAKGTSLGGDDGIAVAYGLALLDDDSIPHPPLEMIFTTNEEIGMLGAAAFDPWDIDGTILLNVDSEDEGVFTVSCAGGASVYCKLPCEMEDVKMNGMTVTFSGFTGGHSGVEINKGRMNATCATGRLLKHLFKESKVQLVDLVGGDKDNAITNSCTMTFAYDKEKEEQVKKIIQEICSVIKEEQAVADPDITWKVEECNVSRGMSITATEKVVVLLGELPQGIMKMNPVMTDMVQTSLNLGITRIEEEQLLLGYSVRSSKTSEKEELISRIQLLSEYLGCSVIVEGNYPGWDYKEDSCIRDTMIRSYKELYGKEPIVEGIHAGLECGLFIEKLPGLDAISFGPQMYDIHTANEKLSISSTKRTWELLLKVLEELR